MSYGAGHILDMINRIKQNRAQRPSNRAKFKESFRERIYSTAKKSERPNFKTVSERELIEIKNQIRTRANAKQKKDQIIYGIFLVCGLIAMIGILMWLG